MSHQGSEALRVHSLPTPGGGHIGMTSGNIVIHCLGGLGRTGLVACKLLTEQGIPAASALEQVRAARPGAVETPEQEAYVLSLTTAAF